MEIFGYLAAILMGVTLGMIGGGGSILTVPILMFFFKQEALIATTESLFIVGTTATVGGLIYARQGLIDFRSGFLFAVPSFLGVYLARHLLLPQIPDLLMSLGDFTLTKELLVLASFAALMVIASFSMIRSPNKHPLPQDSPKTEPRAPSLTQIASRGLLVGFVTGFVGAGGGFLIIPALVILLNLPMRTAVGTSLAIIAANSLFGFSLSLGHPSMNWALLLSVAGLGVLGLLVGRKLSARVEENKLKKGFGYFVLFVGLFILFDQIRR